MDFKPFPNLKKQDEKKLVRYETVFKEGGAEAQETASQHYL